MSENSNVSTPKKFEFATNFASQPAISANDYSDSFEPYTPVHNALASDAGDSHIDIERLMQDSYDQGFYEGRIYAGDSEASFIGKIGKLLELRLTQFESDFRDLQRNLGQTLAGLLTEVLAKIVSGIPEGVLAKTISTHIHKIHTNIPATPLHFKASADIVSRIKSHVDNLIQSGALQITEDNELPKTQCHLEWDQGGWSLRLDQFVDQTLEFLMKPETTSVILAQQQMKHHEEAPAQSSQTTGEQA